MHKKYKQFLHSFVAFPVLAASFALSPVAGSLVQTPIAAAISPVQTGTPASVSTDNQQADPALEVDAAKVDAFFAQYDLPLAGHGQELVKAATENGLDPYVVAAIAFNESTGCEHIIKGTNNCFGWGSGKIAFSSIDQGIDTVATAIGANDPATAHYYAGKDLKTRLRIYNGAANPDYVPNIMWTMNQMDAMTVPAQTASAATNTNSTNA